MPPADTQDPFADMRPHHNHDHWVTKWIRSYMVTPEDRERKLAAVLGKMKMGADELCASPPPSHAAALSSLEHRESVGQWRQQIAPRPICPVWCPVDLGSGQCSHAARAARASHWCAGVSRKLGRVARQVGKACRDWHSRVR